MLPAFWTGMPVVVGSAALLLGLSGRRIAALEGTTAKLATTAAVLGVLAVGVDVIGTIVMYH